MKYWITLMLLLFLLTGCSTNSQENKVDYLESVIGNVFTHELNHIEPEHQGEINNWLNSARKSGEEGHYFIKSLEDVTGENLYTYVYGKGYTDYEVVFIYNRRDNGNEASIRVTGLDGNSESENESFVKIKCINDLSIQYILSDDTLEDQLKD